MIYQSSNISLPEVHLSPLSLSPRRESGGVKQKRRNPSDSLSFFLNQRKQPRTHLWIVRTHFFLHQFQPKEVCQICLVFFFIFKCPQSPFISSNCKSTRLFFNFWQQNSSFINPSNKPVGFLSWHFVSYK